MSVSAICPPRPHTQPATKEEGEGLHATLKCECSVASSSAEVAILVYAEGSWTPGEWPGCGGTWKQGRRCRTWMLVPGPESGAEGRVWRNLEAGAASGLQNGARERGRSAGPGDKPSHLKFGCDRSHA